MLVKVATGAFGLAAAGAAATNDTSLGQIALFITAVSGLIATVGGLVMGLRKKPMDPQDIALLALAERLTRDEDPHEQA